MTPLTNVSCPIAWRRDEIRPLKRGIRIRVETAPALHAQPAARARADNQHAANGVLFHGLILSVDKVQMLFVQVRRKQPYDQLHTLLQHVWCHILSAAFQISLPVIADDPGNSECRFHF